ncbi:MAG: lipopolysaccharide biosynthesis protein, partial [Mesorhizobium sp.]
TQATVQKSGIKHEEVNYLFWVNVAVSALLVCVLAGAAPLVAAFYGEPRVSGLVAALGLQIIAYGLGAQHLALLTRRMQFARLAIIDVASAIAGLAVSIAWTFIDRSYWALFAGTLTAAVLPTLCYWANSRWRPSLPRKVNGISELINF